MNFMIPEPPDEKTFIRGETTRAIVNKEMLSHMITADFQMRGFIPFNVFLEVKNFDIEEEEYLELTMTVQKEYIN